MEPLQDDHSKKQYTADGIQTTFPFPYMFFAATDLEVYVGSAKKTITTDYSVAGIGVGFANGANVVFGTAPANGSRITIVRVLPITQPTDYKDYANFPNGVITADFNRRTMVEQQLLEHVNRQVAQHISEAEDLDLTLPPSDTWPLQFLGFDAEKKLMVGQPVAVPPASPYMQTLLDDVNVLAAQKTLGLLDAGAGAAIAAAIRAFLAAGDASAGRTALAAGSQAAIDLLFGNTRIIAANWAAAFKAALPVGVPVGVHKGFLAALKGTARGPNNRTNTTLVAGKLVDSGATFWTWVASGGDYVYNVTDNKWARIVAADSQIQLSLDRDIFLATGKAYKIWSIPPWTTMGVDNVQECDGSTISDGESPFNGMKVPNLNGTGSFVDHANSGGYFLRAGFTAGIEMEDSLEFHYHYMPYGRSDTLAGGAGSNYRSWFTEHQSDSVTDAITDGTHPLRTGCESRGRSYSVVYIMRIK